MLYFGIPMNAETYDDRLALSAYALRHFRHLMTALDRRVLEYSVPIVSSSENWKIKKLHCYLEQCDGHVPDNEVVALFELPCDERKRRAVQRLLTDHRTEIHENRCPECSRLLRTPLAQQCLWCGHDWH